MLVVEFYVRFALRSFTIIIVTVGDHFTVRCVFLIIAWQYIAVQWRLYLMMTTLMALMTLMGASRVFSTRQLFDNWYISCGTFFALKVEVDVSSR